MTIQLAGTSRPEPDRDQWGRYLIPHPDGGRPKGYQRVTTFASLIQDEFSINQWRMRCMLAGLVHDPSLMLLAHSLIDPVDDEKKTANKIADDAVEAGKASAKARQGTALHTFTEQWDMGQRPNVPAPFDQDIASYASAMNEWEVVDIERIAVNYTHGYAGTYDRILRNKRSGKLYVGDLKTGKQPHKYPHEICVQLACYANAERVFDIESGNLEPVPAVSRTRALVIHLQPGTGQCDLYWFNIQAGWEMIETIKAVRDWRAVKPADLVKPYSPPTQAELLAAMSTAVPATAALPAPQTMPQDESQAPDAADAITAAFEGATVVVEPNPRQPMPTGSGKPEPLPANGGSGPRRIEPLPLPVVAEGEMVEDAAAKVAAAYSAELDEDGRKLVDKWVRQGSDTGRSWKISEMGSTRRFTLYRAALRMVQASGGDEDVCRALISSAIGESIGWGQRSRIGKWLGEMSYEQARFLMNQAITVRDGGIGLTFDDEGHPVLTELPT